MFMIRRAFLPNHDKMPWQLTPVFLPGEFHGQRNLVDYSPKSHKELDTAEHEHDTVNTAGDDL